MIYYFKKTTFLTSLLIFLISLYPANSFSATLESATSDTYFPDLTRRVLDNGLVVVIKEVKTTSLVSVASLVDVGSASEGQFRGSGISHLVEHMLFKGTSTLKLGEIEQKIKSYGGNINGFTSYDSTGYQAVVQNKYLDETLKIMHSMLTEATFDAQEFEKEKDVIVNEINMNRDDPRWQLQTLFFSTAYTAHPYRFPMIGQLPIFRKITREQALSFYHNSHVPNRSVLVICGNIDTKKTLSKVEEIFKSWASNYSLIEIGPSEPKQLGLRRVDKPFKVKLTHILLGFHTVSLQDKDMYPLDVLASILGSKESSRLNQEINRKQGLVYFIEAESFTPRDKGIFNIYVQSEGSKTNSAISAILKEIEKIKNGQVVEEELKKAKDEVLSNYLFGQERIESLAYRLASDELITHNPNFSKRYVEKIREVNLEQLKKVAQKYFTLDNLTLTTIFPEEEKEVTGISSGPTTAKEEKIEKIILPNGLTVLLKENHQLPIVSISAYFLAGVRVENEDNNGISNLTAHMLLAGTKSKKAREISETIEGKGGTISTISGNNSIGISLNLLKEHLETNLMVLVDVLTNSTFPEDELKKEKEKILAEIKSQDDDIFQTASDLFKETLYQKHPYHLPLIGQEKTVNNLSRDNLINFYSCYLKAHNGVLVIFGDIEKNKTAALVEKYFKNLKAAPLKPIETINEPAGKHLIISSKILNKEQAVIMLGFKTIRINNNDRYALDVLSSIMSGGGGKLFEEIRDKLGLSYTLGAYSVPGLDLGYYVFYVATTPENKDKVKELLLKQVEKLKTGYLNEDDIDLAKNYLIGQSQLAWQTNSSLANQAALDQLYGLGYDQYQQYGQKIERVSLEEVKSVVNKYFNLENGALAVVSSK